MLNEPSQYVTLVSSEGFEFVIERRCANVSGTIRAMLSGSYSEAKDNHITFPEISTAVLEKVCVSSLAWNLFGRGFYSELRFFSRIHTSQQARFLLHSRVVYGLCLFHRKKRGEKIIVDIFDVAAMNGRSSNTFTTRFGIRIQARCQSSKLSRRSL